jgi:hypothetical protein
MGLGQVDPIQKRKTRSATERAKHRSTDRLKYYGKEFDRVLCKERNQPKSTLSRPPTPDVRLPEMNS